MLVEIIHSKLLVGCGVGGGEAKANDENGRGCGLGLFLRWLLLHRIFRPIFSRPTLKKSSNRDKQGRGN